MVFNPDSQFTMKAISMLNEAGIIDLKEIEAHSQQLQSIIKVKNVDAIKRYDSLLNLWIEGHANLHPTWRHLFWVLRDMKLNHMADRIESHFHLMAFDQEQANFKPLERSNTEEEGKLIPSAHVAISPYHVLLRCTTSWAKC